jgi:hypothetical protein
MTRSPPFILDRNVIAGMGLLLDSLRAPSVGIGTTTDARAAAFNKSGIKRSSAGDGQTTSSVLRLEKSAHRDWTGLGNQI